MRARAQAGSVPVLTVVELLTLISGRWVTRWCVLDERGGEASVRHKTLRNALEWAAWQTVAWELWVAELRPILA